MRYLLDTNICIYIIKKKPRVLVKKFENYEISDIAISSITFAELEYGIQKSAFSIQNRIALHQFLAPLEILPYDGHCACHYGKLRKFLEESGQVIGSLDMLIASHCLALNYVLITNNEKKFERIPDLKVRNWLKDL